MTTYRVFLRNADTDALHYLIWVRLTGADFYWGSPGQNPDIAGQLHEPGTEQMTFTVPDNFDDLPTANSKTSIHASGMMHTTSDGSGAQAVPDQWVGPVASFRQPTLFAAVLTAVPELKGPYRRSPGRGGATPLTFTVPGKSWASRWYADFHLTPPGTFEQPPALLLRDGAVPDFVVMRTLSLELDLILVVRVQPMPGFLDDWHPDKRILIAATPQQPPTPHPTDHR